MRPSRTSLTRRSTATCTAPRVWLALRLLDGRVDALASKPPAYRTGATAGRAPTRRRADDEVHVLGRQVTQPSGRRFRAGAGCARSRCAARAPPRWPEVRERHRVAVLDPLLPVRGHLSREVARGHHEVDVETLERGQPGVDLLAAGRAEQLVAHDRDAGVLPGLLAEPLPGARELLGVLPQSPQDPRSSIAAWNISWSAAGQVTPAASSSSRCATGRVGGTSCRSSGCRRAAPPGAGGRRRKCSRPGRQRL